MSERNTKLATQVVRMELDLNEARELLRRVMEALDHEIDRYGPVPFDPDEIRKFLE